MSKKPGRRLMTWIFAGLALVSVVGGGWWAYNAMLQAVLDAMVMSGLERSLNNAGGGTAAAARPPSKNFRGSALAGEAVLPSATGGPAAPAGQPATAGSEGTIRDIETAGIRDVAVPGPLPHPSTRIPPDLAPPAPDPTPPAGGAITGRVLKARAGGPIAGATVRLADDPQTLREFVDDDESRKRADGAAAPSATTGEDGRFELRGLPEGEHRIRLGHPLAAPRLVEGIRVWAGAATDLGDLRLGRGCMVHGRVTDREGRPVHAEGFVVAAFPAGGMGPLGASGRSGEDPAAQEFFGRPDADGEYRIQGLAPGSYILVALQESELRSSRSGNLLRQKRAVLRPGESVRVDIQVGLGARLEGVVLDRGKPVATAEVVIARVDGDAAKNLMTSLAVAEVDAEGRFGIDDLPAGDYVALVSLTGTEPSYTRRFRIEQGWTEHELDLSVPTGSVSGRVSLADGRPAARARLVLEGAQKEPELSGLFGLIERMSSSTETRGDGSFALPGVRPGRYSISTKLPDYVTARSAEFDVVQDLDTGPVGLVLVPGRTIRGTVRDVSGSPLANVKVWAYRGDSAGELLDSTGDRTESGPDGRFVVEGLAPGEYSLAFRKTGYADALIGPIGIGAEPLAPLELLMRPGGGLRLTLVDALSTEPLEGAAVDLARAQDRDGASQAYDPEDFVFGGKSRRTTTVDGAAEWRDLAPGLWKVLLLRTDPAGAETQLELGLVQVASGETAEARYEVGR